MRSFNKILGAYNSSAQKERRFAIRIEIASGVYIWVVSHSDVTPGTGTVLAARLSSVSNISQRMYPLEGRAEIGALSFDAVDIDQALSAELRTQLLTNDRGAFGKTVQFYLGDARADFSSYEVETTQVLQSCTVGRSGTEYKFRCRDVQREERKDALDPKETRLTAGISETDTTISVISTADFEGLDHGTSFSDAPSAAGVIYFRIDKEIIRTLAADATATTFTNCVRGVLGTQPEAHTTDEDAPVTPDKGKKVEEVIYLEMPAPKLAYALQTGNLINQAGTLPDHWHAAMGADKVKLSDYTGIGLDLYDPDDDTEGVILRFVDPGKTDVKRFVESDILRPLGLFQPVGADGQLGLRRLRRIVQGAGAVRELNDSVLLSAPSLEFAGEDIRNEIELGWNELDGDLTRSVIVQDATSTSLWGLRKRLEMKARGLHGSRQSKDVIVSILQQTFDRRSGPPIRTSAQVHGSQADIEIGDVVRLVTSHCRDWTGQTISLDRPFEVQGKRTDWLRNRVTFDLEASSQTAAPLSPLTDDESIADAWFSSAGTNIAGLAGVTDEGTHLLIGADLSLTGSASLRNAAAIYYATKDVIVGAGVTVTISQNVQIRCAGVWTENGKIDGAGNGLAGVADTLDTSTIPSYPETKRPVDITFQSGQSGGFGSTQAQGGLIERVRQENEGSGFYGFLQSVPAPVTAGKYDVLPHFQVRYADGGVQGLPDDLRGSSGGPGGLRYWEESRAAPNVVQVNKGGTGGAGGAGLAIIARGIAFGASGLIDTSGAAGSVGGYSATNQQPAHAGGGAGGAPGGVLLLIDGSLNPAPGSISGRVLAEYGTAPLPTGDFNALPQRLIDTSQKIFFGSTVPDDRFTADRSVSSAVDATFAATRVQFMPPSATPEPTSTDEEIAGEQGISLAVVEAYSDVADDNITRLKATVTEVSTTGSYSHANIYMRPTDVDIGWTKVGTAEPNLSFDVPADGVSRTFVAVPVLENNLEAGFAFASNSVAVTVTPGATGVNFDAVTGDDRPENKADVTAEHGANFVDNPEFEAGDKSWGGISDWAVVNDPSNARRGSWAAHYTGTALNADLVNSKVFQVEAGDRILAQASVKVPTGDWQARVYVRFFDDARNTVRLGGANNGNNVSSTTYGQSRVVTVTPAGAVYAQVRVRPSGGTGAANVWVDGVYGFPMLRNADVNALETEDGPVDPGATANDLQSVSGSDSAADGDTSVSVTINRQGNKTLIQLQAKVSGADGANSGNPFPVAYTLKRGGVGGTTIKTWDGVAGYFEAGGGGDPDIAYMTQTLTFTDTNTGVGSTEYYVSGPSTAFTDEMELYVEQDYDAA